MKLLTQLRSVLTILLIAVLTAHPAQADGTLLGGGSTSTAWFVTKRSDSPSALLLMLRDDPLGSIRPGVTIDPLPHAIAVRSLEAVAVYPSYSASPQGESDEPGVMRAVRRYQAELLTPTQIILRGPDALPPITGPGDLLGLIYASAPTVLLRHESRLRLLIYHRGAWVELEAPPQVHSDARLTLLPMSGRPLIVAHSPDAHLADAFFFNPDSDESAGQSWTRRSIAVPIDTERLLVVDDQIISLARGSSPDELRIDVVRTDSAVTRTRLAGVPGDYLAFPLDGSIIITWSNPDDVNSAPIIAAVSLDGRVLREPAPAVVIGPVSPDDVQLLLLVLASIFLTAIIFIARPGARQDDSFVLPPDAALAPPWRRTTAAAIDLLPGLAVAYLLEADVLPPNPVSEWLDGVVGLILLVVVITIFHTSICEPIAGRTLGKWITRCRTISHNARRPSLLQALGRNAAKVLCPPLALLTVVAPYAPNPGSFATRVIVKISQPGSDHPEV